MTKLFKFLLSASTIVVGLTPLMVSCGNNDTPKPKNITILKAPTKMRVGDQIKLEIKVDPEQSYKGVKWSSSDPNIISVAEKTGKIEARAVGSAVITAQSDKYEDIKATCNIEVEGATSTYEYDLTKPFVPTISPMCGTLDLDSATKTYLSDASTFKAIIADDLAYTWYTLGIVARGYTKLTVNSVGIDVRKSTLSLNIHSDCRIEEEGRITTAQNLIFQAIPLQVVYGDPGLEIGNVWGTSPNVGKEGQFFLQDDNWMFYEQDTIDGQTEIHQWDKEKLLQEEEIQRALDIITIMMVLSTSFPGISYYLSETTPA